MTSDVRKKIDLDPDYIHIKRFDYSLNKLIERYPDGVPTRIIAQALQMDETEVEELYLKVLAKLRNELS